MSGSQTPSVYRTRDPEIIAAWMAALTAIDDYCKATRAVLDEHGLTDWDALRLHSSWFYGTVQGVSKKGSDLAPEGWRGSGRGDYYVPDKRTAAGKRTARALDAVKHPGNPLNSLKGMPSNVLRGMGGYLHSPDVRMIGDALYAEWAICLEGDSIGDGMTLSGRTREVDLSIWERVKLSEYWAAREAADEERAAGQGAS